MLGKASEKDMQIRWCVISDDQNQWVNKLNLEINSVKVQTTFKTNIHVPTSPYTFSEINSLV